MSTISTITPSFMGAPPRSPQGRAYLSYEDEIYDPVLDPAVNPAVEGGIEQIEVTAKREDDAKVSFWDLLDLVNPLQHIPGINTLYRELTGDTIKAPAKIIGATVLGGPIGFAAAMVDSVVEETTGRDIGGHAMAMLSPRTPAAPQTELAAATAPAAQDQSVAREFIPDAVAPALPAGLAAATVPAAAPAVMPAAQAQRAARAYDRTAALKAAPAPSASAAPGEAEALVQTAQIAAQANVFPTFKRTGPSAAERAAANEATAQAAQSQAGDGYKALDRTASRSLDNVPRHSGAPTSAGELRARTKYPPGSRLSGGATMSPASLAAASAARSKTVAPVVPSAPLAAPAPSAQTAAAPRAVAPAQDAYAYGRQAAAGTVPQDVPAWFDNAMLGAIDKYNAMQQAK